MGISRSAVHAVSLGFMLYALWLLLSGHYGPLLLVIGAVSCIVIVAIAMRLDVIDHEAVPLHLSVGYLAYLAWLGREIVQSNIHVARVILDPALPISPRLFWTRSTQATDVGRVIFANSITLTPGTVSIELEDDRILVHAITRAAADGLQSGEMDRRVTAIEAR